jgi:hypothetical protein
MTIERAVENMRSLWHAQALVTDLKVRHLLFRSGIGAFAALIATFGLLMAELAAYFALVQFWSAIYAAVMLSVVNFVIAALMGLIAVRLKPSRELALADHMQRSAFEALQADAKGIRQDFASVRSVETILATLLIPLVSTLIRAAKKNRAAATTRDDPKDQR